MEGTLAQPNHTRVIRWTAAFISAALLLAVAVTLARTGSSTPVTGQAPTSTPEPTLDPLSYSSPITTSQTAIDKSLVMFPSGITPTITVARLVSISTLDTWRNAHSPLTEPHAPAWLVGIGATGLTVRDVLPEYFGSGRKPAVGNQIVEGKYFAWDANSGVLLGEGTLGGVQGSGQTLASINLLQAISATFTPATMVVPDLFPTDTPDPAINP